MPPRPGLNRPARLFLLVAVPAVFLATAAWAALPARPDGYVTDGAGILSDPTEAGLESVMADLDRKTGAQMAVVTVPDLAGREVAEAAEALFRSWGIGRKGKDDGVLFLVAPRDRKARIEVGYGLEGLLPDARAGRILDENAMGDFRAGRMEAGVVRASLAVAGVIAQDRGVELSGAPVAPPQKQAPVWLTILLSLVFGYIVFRNPFLLLLFLGGGRRGGGWSGGGGGFGGFGGFGGGSSGGGGASRGW